jgi:subtilisin family serine protease
MWYRLGWAVLLLAGTAPSLAQSDDSDKDRLKRMLEERSANRTRSATPPAPQSKSDEIIVIRPGGDVRVVPESGVTRTSPRSWLSGGFQVSGGLLAPPDQKRRAYGVRIAESDPRASPGSSSGNVVVRPGRIVIQLKPSTTPRELDHLIAKYDLKDPQFVPALGALYVDLPARPQSSRSLESVLEPPIVLQLRQEPIVETAFVDVSVAPRTVPRPSGATAAGSPNRTLRWYWTTGASDDGNWGLKALRVPAVWTLLRAARQSGTVGPPPVMAFLDSGFSTVRSFDVRTSTGEEPVNANLDTCERSHGTHVTGIASATFRPPAGVDGVVPSATVDLVQIRRELVLQSAWDGTSQAQQQVSFFVDALSVLAEYLDRHPPTPTERRVVNISLAYNWGWATLVSGASPTNDRTIRDQIRQHARFVQYLVNKWQKQVLFVVAAGNDSHGLETPLQAELASPFAFAALSTNTPGFTPSSNIMVVEAHGRDYRRASFSNIGGHVSAPGVDIMSTFASSTTPFGVCDGTSQAAPYMSGLATVLFQLDPTRSPADIIDVIRRSALSPGFDRGAPRADALNAVIQLDRRNLTRLADLNNDGRVDAADLEVFIRDMTAIQEGRFEGQITRDLNNDGVVDANERCWPRIDLNGSGRASLDPSDIRAVGGAVRSDLDIIEAAWTDTAQSFKSALAGSALPGLIAIWRSTAGVATEARLALTAPCQ